MGSTLSNILHRISDFIRHIPIRSIQSDPDEAQHRPTREQFDALSLQTGFTLAQLKHFYERFAVLDTHNLGRLDHTNLKSIEELGGEQNPLGERIVEVLLNNYGTAGKYIDFAQFVRVLAIFRKTTRTTTSKQQHQQSQLEQPNSRANKLRFIFNVYDKNRDERISREDLLSILDLMVQFRYPEDMDKAEKEKEEKNRECLLMAIMSRMVEELDATTAEVPSSSDDSTHHQQQQHHFGPHETQVTFDMFCKALSMLEVEEKMSMKFMT